MSCRVLFPMIAIHDPHVRYFMSKASGIEFFGAKLGSWDGRQTGTGLGRALGRSWDVPSDDINGAGRGSESGLPTADPFTSPRRMIAYTSAACYVHLLQKQGMPE